MSKGIEYVISVIDRATAPLRRITASIGSVGQRFKKSSDEVKSNTDKITNSVKGLGAAVGLAFGISAVIGFGRELVDITAKFQRYDAVLKTQYLGNEQMAGQAYDKVVNFANNAALPIDNMVESFIKLKGQGFDPTTEELQKLSDIAASTGKPFDQLAEAILDAQTGEFERLKEFGIKASAVGDKVAFNFRGQTTVVSKTADAMRNHLLSIGNMDGVQGSTNAIAETMGGGLQKISNQWLQFKRDLGDSLAPVVSGIARQFSKLLSYLKPVGDWLKEHPTFVKMLAVGIGIATGALVIFTVAIWAMNTALWANPITWVVAAIIALSLAIAWVITYTEGWGKSFSALGRIVVAIKDIIVISFRQAWADVKFGVDMVWLKTKSFFQWIGQAVQNVFNALNKLKNFDFEGAYSAISAEIKTSASVEISKRESEYKSETANNMNNISGKLNGIAKDWQDVGITVKKDAKGLGETMKDAMPTGNAGASTKNSASGAKADAKAAGKAGKQSSRGINSGGSKPTTYNITIHKLQDKIEIITQTIKEGGQKAADEVANQIAEALYSLDGKM